MRNHGGERRPEAPRRHPGDTQRRPKASKILKGSRGPCEQVLHIYIYTHIYTYLYIYIIYMYIYINVYVHMFLQGVTHQVRGWELSLTFKYMIMYMHMLMITLEFYFCLLLFCYNARSFQNNPINNIETKNTLDIVQCEWTRRF